MQAATDLKEALYHAIHHCRHFIDHVVAGTGHVLYDRRGHPYPSGYRDRDYPHPRHQRAKFLVISNGVQLEADSRRAIAGRAWEFLRKPC